MAQRGKVAGDRDGVVLEAARRGKERTYPEIAQNRARLVVFGAWGRWSEETRIRALVRTRAKSEPRQRTGQAWPNAMVVIIFLRCLVASKRLWRGWRVARDVRR